MLDTSSLEHNLVSETNGHNETSLTRNYPTVDELLQRCNLLIAELESFKEHLKANRQENTVEIAHFRNTVKSELRTLERLADDGKSEEATQHTVNSSNLPFLETVWAVVKNTSGLQALQKRFYWHGGLAQERSARQAISGRNNDNVRIPDKKKQSALVDIVGKNGLEWTKVSLITNTRLLFDKAKQGWEEVSSSEDDDDDDNEEYGVKVGEKIKNGKEEEDDNDVPLVRMAKDLFKAANVVRIRTNHPRIRLVLPKIEEGQIDEIDDILATLRNLGCIVDTAEQNLASPSLERVVHKLLTDPFAELTQTLNIDCTILLALVSDFSHCSVEAEPWFHRALKRQVEIEDKENLLPNLLYPAISNHVLVCTKEAAKRMIEIVETIGTPGEKARTKLIMASGDMPDEPVSEEAAKKLRDELQEWSKFEVPSTLNLPIKIVDSGVRLTNAAPNPTIVSLSEETTPPTTSSSSSSAPATQATEATETETETDPDPDPILSHLPPSAIQIKKNLTWINQSVFLHGWANGRSTITSNRTVVKQIDNLLEAYAQSEGEWPSIWLCPTARSLVGKEKGRRD